MLNWQEEKMKLREKYKKMHVRLDNHRDLITIGNLLLLHWQKESGRNGGIFINYASDFSQNVTLNLNMRKEDSKKEIAETLKFLYNNFDFSNYKRETYSPILEGMYWHYCFKWDKGSGFKNYNRYVQFSLYFFLDTIGICRRVKVGEEMMPIYKVVCDEVPV